MTQMKGRKRRPLLPQVFERREHFLEKCWDSAEWESAHGVEFHPLARILNFPIEDLSEVKRPPILEHLSLNYVGCLLLDGLPWCSCLDKPGTPCKNMVTEKDALRVFFEKNVVILKGAAQRAAAGWQVVICYFPDIVTFKKELAACFPGRKDAKGRVNVIQLMATLSNIEYRTMATALKSAATFDSSEFFEVLSGERETFHETQFGRLKAAVEVRSTALRHRIYAAGRIANEKNLQPDLQIYRPNIKADQPLFLASADSLACLVDLRNILSGTDKYSATSFVCLILPPQLVITDSFQALIIWAKDMGWMTRATVGAVVKTGLARNDVSPSWEFIWVLARSPDQRLHQPFINALTPSPDLTREDQWIYIFTRLIQSFCPPKGVIYFDGLDSTLLEVMVSAVDQMGTKLIVADYYENYLRERFSRRARKRNKKA